MKKIVLLIMVLLLNDMTRSNACQTIHRSFFELINKTETVTDIAVFTNFFCVSSPPPPLIGYTEEIHSDTLYFKVLYKGRITSGSGYMQARYDTFTNIALPQNINYLHVSGNVIKVNSQGQITDTSWNETDSTFILHPTAISDISKSNLHINFYPNPAHNTLFFEKDLEYEQVRVYNSIGQCIALYQKNKQSNINISALSKGIYFIKLLGKKEEVIGWARFVKVE